MNRDKLIEIIQNEMLKKHISSSRLADAIIKLDNDGDKRGDFKLSKHGRRPKKSDLYY